MKWRLQVLENDPLAGPAKLFPWAQSRDVELLHTRLHKGEALPDSKDFDALVVLGGSMGSYEENQYSWLAPEKKFLEKTVASGKQVVGICLGSQLLADALGGKTYKGKFQEIGWFPIDLTPLGEQSPFFNGLPSRFNVFQWHGDTFELPKNAIRLGGSTAYDNQIFQVGANAIGIQFHPEVDEDTILKWIEQTDVLPTYPEEPYVQRKDEMIHQSERLSRQTRLFETFLDRFFSRRPVIS